MEPARSIVRKLGGEAVAAKITGVAFSGPYRWQYPREAHGQDGMIPVEHIPKIVRYARRKKLPIDLPDFFPQLRTRHRVAKRVGTR
jgi:hypothetical protein